MPETEGKPKGGFFRKLGKWAKKHKVLVIILALVLAAAIFLVSCISRMVNAVANLSAAPQTLTLERMDLEQIVSGTGTLQSSESRDVTSALSYKVATINVKEGDWVEKGAVLATLDATDLDKEIADKQKSINEAQAESALSLQQAQRKLQDAQDQLNIDTVNAQKDVDEARDEQARAHDIYDPLYNKLQALEQALADARAERDRIDADPDATDEDKAKAQAAVVEVKNKRDAKQVEVDAAWPACNQADQALQAAVEKYDSTIRQDNLTIQSAQDNINTLTVKDSTSALKTQLDALLDDQKDCIIYAPISGTVTSIGAELGQSAGSAAAAAVTSGSTTGSALFTIENTRSMEISSSIPEYDAVNLSVGMPADVTTDAIDGKEWTGAVKSISPKATDTSGNFTVVVSITSAVDDLAIGMSGKVNVITESKADVFAVPYDAVTTDAAGGQVVYLYDPAAQAGESGRPAGDNGQPTNGDSRPGGEMPALGGDSASDGGKEGGSLPQSAASGTVVGGMQVNADGTVTAAAPQGTPIPVETGMETDYYIEISGDGLYEGMTLLADPEGKNVVTDPLANMGFVMGGPG